MKYETNSRIMHIILNVNPMLNAALCGNLGAQARKFSVAAHC